VQAVAVAVALLLLLKAYQLTVDTVHIKQLIKLLKLFVLLYL
jgi:hypothetical protein